MSSRLSRSAAGKLRPVQANKALTEEQTKEIRANDARIAGTESLVAIEEGLHETIVDVIGDLEQPENSEAARVLVTARGEIIGHWREVGKAYLAIGSALLDLDEKLNEQQKKRLRIGSEKIFPFGDSVASMLRMTARMVSQGRVTEAQLPGSYATAYVLARMDEQELLVARARGLVHPGVGRPALLRFRREYSSAQLAHRVTADDVPRAESESLNKIDLTSLALEMTELVRRRQEMLDGLLRDRKRMMELRRILRQI